MAEAALADWSAVNPQRSGGLFGHVNYARNPDVEAIWSKIIKALGYSDDLDQFIFVASETEHPIFKSAHQRATSEPNGAINFTFGEFFKRSDNLDQVFGLAQRTVVMLSVDRNMSADYAMALIAATSWATKTIGGTKRVLTVSCLSRDPRMTRLVKYFGHPTVQDFNFDDHLPESPPRSVSLGNASNIAPTQATSKLVGNVRALDGRQIIVLVSDALPLETKDLDDEETGVRWVERAIDFKLRAFDEAFIKECLTNPRRQNVLMRVPLEFTPHRGLSGFDHIHLVVKSTYRQLQLDSAVGQMVKVPLKVSKEVRLDQVDWYLRRVEEPSTVTVYLDEAVSVEAWVNDGPENRRLLIENSQLGGFLSAVASISWVEDPHKLARCFVSDALMTEFASMSNRLQAQNILLNSELRINLPTREMSMFVSALPIVQYDHRLALLVAQWSNSPLVNETKLELAAMMTLDLLELFKLPEGQTVQLNDLVKVCGGSAIRLVQQGVIWLALGMLKDCQYMTGQFGGANPNSLHEYHQIGETALRICIPLCQRFIEVWRQLRHAMTKAGYPLATDAETLYKQLSKAECYEIQSHLLLAYISQLSLGGKARDGLRWKDVTTKRTINGEAGWTRGLFSATGILEAEPDSNECLFAIYHQLARNGSTVNFLDWTYIPTDIVEEWHHENCQGQELTSVLDVVAGPCPNIDDVSQEWEDEDF